MHNIKKMEGKNNKTGRKIIDNICFNKLKKFNPSFGFIRISLLLKLLFLNMGNMLH